MCFIVIFSGEDSICQGGGGVEQGPGVCSLQEVDDVFLPPLASTPMQQPKTKTSVEESSKKISQDVETVRGGSGGD